MGIARASPSIQDVTASRASVVLRGRGGYPFISSRAGLRVGSRQQWVRPRLAVLVKTDEVVHHQTDPAMSSPNDVGTSGKGRVTWREFADLMLRPATADPRRRRQRQRISPCYFLPAAQRTPAKIAALYGQQTAAKVVAMGAVSSAARREPAPRPREQRGCAGNTRIRGSRRSSSSSAGGGIPPPTQTNPRHLRGGTHNS